MGCETFERDVKVEEKDWCDLEIYFWRTIHEMKMKQMENGFKNKTENSTDNQFGLISRSIYPNNPYFFSNKLTN